MKADHSSDAVGCAYFAKLRQDLDSRFRVQTCNGLICKDQLGLLDQRARNAHPLLLTAG